MTSFWHTTEPYESDGDDVLVAPVSSEVSSEPVIDLVEPAVPPANMPSGSKRHLNPDGTPGGWVSPSATVEPTVFMGPFVTVTGNAWVGGHSRLFDEVSVSGSARVSGEAVLGGTVRVCDGAAVEGSAAIFGSLVVRDRVVIGGSSCLGLKRRSVRWPLAAVSELERTKAT